MITDACSEVVEDPRERFLGLLPRRPYCADDPRFGVFIRPRDVAISRSYIQPNAPWRYVFLPFDVDREGAALAADEAGLPRPTYTIINPGTAHAHGLYELEYPLYRGRSIKADWLFDAVWGGLGSMLNADPDYCGLLVQTPFHPRWMTLQTNARFDLQTLAAHIPSNLLKPRRQIGQHWLDASSRNCHLFDAIRRSAYCDVRHFGSQAEFYEHVLSLCRVQNIYPSPLRESEIRSTARSISKWTWRRRDRFVESKRRGAMHLAPLAQDQCHGSAIKLRQALGAKYARAQRTGRIDSAIERAVEDLGQAGKPITVSALIKLTKVSRSTIYRRRCIISLEPGNVSSGAIRK